MLLQLSAIAMSSSRLLLLRVLPHSSSHAPVQLFSVSSAASASVGPHNASKLMRNRLSPNLSAPYLHSIALANPKLLHSCGGYAECGVCRRISGAREDESCRRPGFWFRRGCDPAQVSSTLKSRKWEEIGRCFFSGETSSIYIRERRRASEDGNGFVMGVEAKRIEEEKQKKKRRLVLYSKPGCCLCDGLKEKLHLVFMMGGEGSVSDDVELEVNPIFLLSPFVFTSLSLLALDPGWPLFSSPSLQSECLLE